MHRLIAIPALCFIASAQPPDPIKAYLQILGANPKSSVANYRIGEFFIAQRDYSTAANCFREALNGDWQPPWTVVWSHIQLGKIFLLTGQPERARAEFQEAIKTQDNTAGALGQAEAGLRGELENLRHGPDASLDATVSEYPPVPLQFLPAITADYTPEARLARLEGTAWVNGTLDSGGRIRDAYVSQPLGLGLDEKAIASVYEARFPPVVHNGKPFAAPVTIPVDFLIRDGQSRWRLPQIVFRPPPGATPPRFVSAPYPEGAGISRALMEHAQVVAAIGRAGIVTLSLEIDTHGVPAAFSVLHASEPVWGEQAINVVREWRFHPGINGKTPVRVPCELTLLWGPRTLTADQLRSLVKSADLAAVHRLHAGDIAATTYSPQALEAKAEGAVLIAVVVGEDGVPRDLRSVRSLGHGLDERALEAAARWRFKPPLRHRRPVAVPTILGLRFTLPAPE